MADERIGLRRKEIVMGSHLVENEFQSDKYPTTPRGKVPLSVKDTTAQDLLWEYAQRRRVVDAEFSDDLEAALRAAGYEPKVSVCFDCLTRGGDDARVPALHMAEWIVQQPSGVDHACSRCLPDGEIVIPGFMCARHVAMGLMAAAGKCVDCAKVATHQKCARGPGSGHPFGTPLCATHACPDCTPYAALAVNKLGERTEHWPEDAPCYKCGKPIGPPWSDKLIPTRPVCPVCAMDNIRTALDRYEPRPKPPTKRFI